MLHVVICGCPNTKSGLEADLNQPPLVQQDISQHLPVTLQGCHFEVLLSKTFVQDFPCTSFNTFSANLYNISQVLVLSGPLLTPQKYTQRIQKPLLHKASSNANRERAMKRWRLSDPRKGKLPPWVSFASLVLTYVSCSTIIPHWIN